ncbi:hypothetical protein T11_6430, partial [Trichinella zimbabwensis]
LSLVPWRPGKNLKNDFLEFFENSQHIRLSLDRSRPKKNLKNDFLEFFENSQHFRLSLAVPGPQLAQEKSEK